MGRVVPMHTVPRLSLANGVKMEQLGYGVYKVPPAETAGLVTLAIESGYRSIDTAALYANESGVGEAVRNAVAGDGLSREDLFITSKIWNDQHGYDQTLRAFDTSMSELGLEYIDLMLIHWPCPAKDLYVETYRALEMIYHEGRVRAIGVSNFEPEHLEKLLAETDVPPAVNQVELHPFNQQNTLQDFHAKHGIRTEAWSPLGRGSLLQEPAFLELADEYGKSAAQVILRWHVQLGNIVIPKASSAGRIRENINVFDFALDEKAMERIAALERGQRYGSHPNEVN